MKRYIERTKLTSNDRFYLNMHEAFALAKEAYKDSSLPLDAIALAFDYGRAKGYRAAKAEVRKWKRNC